MNHGDVDSLSCLAVSYIAKFDREEQETDASTCSICTIEVINRQLNITDPGLLAKASSKEPVVSTVKCYVNEGWPQRTESKEV